MHLPSLIATLVLAAPAAALQTGWQQQTYFKGLASDPGDQFGSAVDIDGDWMAVGVPGDASNSKGVSGDPTNNGAPGSGAVYLYRRAGLAWQLKAYLKASNSQTGDHFGSALAIDGDMLVVGAPSEDSASSGVNPIQNDNGAPNSGAIYVFKLQAGKWSQTHYIKGPDPDNGDAFGTSVDLDGNRLIVGAPAEGSAAKGVNGDFTDNAAELAGAAYVFERVASTWQQTAYLKASNTDAGDQFGIAVALSGDLAFVGANWEDGGSSGVAGNPDDNSVSQSGAVYSFERLADGWHPRDYIKASNPTTSAKFGQALAVAGTRLLVGAPGESSAATGIDGNQSTGTLPNAGAVYLFEGGSGASYVQSNYIKASNTSADDRFGSRIASSSERFIVTAPGEDGSSAGLNGNQTNDLASNAGAVYLFERTLGLWRQAHYIKASHPSVDAHFGVDAAATDGLLAIGSFGESSSSKGMNGTQLVGGATDSGAVFTFIPPPSGCGSTSYPPASGTTLGKVRATTLPLGGMKITLEAEVDVGASLATLMVSSQPANLPFLGGTVLVDPLFAVPGPGATYTLALAGGSGELTFQLPSTLAGQSFYAQVAHVVPAPSPFVGWSNGLHVAICP